MVSVNVFWIRPGGKTDHDVELPKETADDPVGVCGGTEAIKLRHHAGQRPVHIANGEPGPTEFLGTLLPSSALSSPAFFVQSGRRLARRDRQPTNVDLTRFGPVRFTRAKCAHGGP